MMDPRKSSGPFSGLSFYPAAFFAYLGLFVAIFPDVVFLGTSFAKRDILRYYYPVWHFAVERMKEGIFPLWNPYNSYGTPFFADIQTCVLYPFSLLWYLPNFLLGFNLYILLHLALAGLFTCIWMRDIGASRPAAFLSGFCFALSGYSMSAINLTISLASLVYFPLVLLCLRRVFSGIKNGGRAFGGHGYFKWQAAGAAVMLFQYLAGDPAVLFATMVVCTVFTLFKTAAVSAVHKRLEWRYGARFTGMVALFLGLSAFHTLLFFEFLKSSNRATPTFDAMTMWSLQYNDLIAFFFPYFSDISLFFMDYWVRQSWLENCYAGITVFFLSALAIRWRRNDMTGYFVLLSLFGLALAMGRWCYIYNLLYYFFPFFKYIRYPIRFVFVFHFSAACLAGIGLDALLAKLDRDKESLLTPKAALGLAVLLVASVALVLISMVAAPWVETTLFSTMHSFMESWSKLDWSWAQIEDLVLPVMGNMKRTALLVTFMLLGVLAVLHYRPRRALVVVFFTLLAFGDLVEANVFEMRVPGGFLERTGKNMDVLIADKGPLFRCQAAPSASQFSVQPPLAPTLDDVLQQILEVLSPNLLLPHRVAYIAGYDSLFIKEAVELNGQGRTIVNPAEFRYLDMLNIKYTVSLREGLDKSYERLQYAKPGYLYLNHNVLPRAFLVPRAETVKEHEEVLKKLVTKEFDPLSVVYVEEAVDEGAAPPAVSQGKVTIEHYGPNEVRMSVESPRAQWLFFSDMFYPGWKAWVDGRPVKIHRANYAFRAVRVPTGGSRVHWKYDPIWFKIGIALSALTVLGILGVLLAQKRRA
jgi:hypothetical protein